MLRPPSREHLRRLLVLLVPLAVYAGSLGHPFQYDDFHSIVDNPAVRSLDRIPTYFADPHAFSGDPSIAMYRPLLLVTYAVNHAVSGYDTWSWHLVNALAHAACAYVVYLLAAALGLRPAGACVAALAFALHPVNVESVNYISSRSELLAGLCVAAGLYLHVRAPSAVGVAALYVLGLGAKSMAVVLPALCLGYDLLQRRDHLRRRLPAYGAMAAVTGLYLAGVGHFLRRAAFEAPVRPLAEQFWTQVKAVVFYLRLLAVPRGLSVDHQFQLSSGPNDPIAVSAFLALGSAALVLLLQFRRRPRVAFLALWFLVSLAPASAVPLNVLVNEHRLYLPSAAFAVALGLCWQAWSDRYRGRCEGRRPLAPAAAMLVCLAALTWQRSQVWASDYALWRDAAGKAPLMARPHMMLAEAHARDGYAERAAAAMAKALERDPGYAPGYEMLGRLHRQAGRLDTAEAWLRRGLARDPDRAGLWGELGTSLVQRAARASGEGAAALYSEALDAFSRAAALEPDEIAHRNNLGNCLQVLGRPAEALAHHRAALRLAPRDPETLLNLGNAHQMLGNLDSAEARYRQALAADGAFAGAWANLGSVLDRQGRAAAALDAYRRAAGLDSRYAPLVRHRQAGPSGRRP